MMNLFADGDGTVEMLPDQAMLKLALPVDPETPVASAFPTRALAVPIQSIFTEFKVSERSHPPTIPSPLTMLCRS